MNAIVSSKFDGRMSSGIEHAPLFYQPYLLACVVVFVHEQPLAGWLLIAVVGGNDAAGVENSGKVSTEGEDDR
jgi:hypothetical protein